MTTKFVGRIKQKLRELDAGLQMGNTMDETTMQSTVMTGVREYAEGDPVELELDSGRLVVTAYNEGGYCCTAVDLLDLIGWLRRNRPDLLNDADYGKTA